MRSQETRSKLTVYWEENGIKAGNEFAILTNVIHQEWTEISVKDYKIIKGLQS